MKVLLLAWDFPPGKGGIQIWMGELAQRLPDSQVTVFAPAVRGTEASDAASHAQVRRLASARWGTWAYVAHVALLTALASVRRRPDVIVCGHLLTSPAALMTRLLFGVPYVVFTYGWEVRRRLHPAARWALHRAARVVACSRFTADALAAHGVSRSRVRLLFPGVDPARFAPDATRGPPPDARALLTVARLSERYKGHDTVLRALPLVLDRCPTTRYVIVGDGPLRSYLGQLAHGYGLDGAVTFLGEIADDALADAYQSCDVLVQLSRESRAGGGVEGFGIACLEAAACAKPVVAGRSGGLPDAVQDGVTGILVDPEDVAEAADAIISLLRDPQRARRLGEAGRARVLQRFTWDRVLAEARQVFEEACASST